MNREAFDAASVDAHEVEVSGEGTEAAVGGERLQGEGGDQGRAGTSETSNLTLKHRGQRVFTLS